MDKEDRLKQLFKKLKKKAEKEGTTVKELLKPPNPDDILKKEAKKQGVSVKELMSWLLNELEAAYERGEIGPEDFEEEMKFDEEAKKN